MTYDELSQQAAERHLTVLGGFHPVENDLHVPDGCQTVILLGPNEPDFWPAFQSAPESQDGQPDPMDRWSTRVIGAWAELILAKPLFPFGGPPYLPFFSWALETGRIHQSPIMLLVHDAAGLFVSFRGALALPELIDLPAPPPSPCNTCRETPCKTACPVDALDGTSYDVHRCKSYLGTPEGKDCMEIGCAARRVCPVSQAYPRNPAQSAFHMTAFKG